MSRFDRRTEEEFRKDIKRSTRDQVTILKCWLKTIGKTDLKYWDKGSDNSGRFIRNNKNVTTDPDYEIEKLGLVEIQYANPMCPTHFHLKEGKLHTCIRKKAQILMVNGWKENVPKFTLIGVRQCKVIAARCELVKWFTAGNKPAYKVPINLLQWSDLQK